MRWYAVHAKPRMELWARSNLWQRGLEVYLPQYRKRRRHARKVDVVSAPLFPRYLFVQADLKSTGRRIIDNAPGVSGLVAFGGVPAAVPEPVIREIRGREDAEGFVRLVDPRKLKPGDPVSLIDGPLGDVDGLLSGSAGPGRVVVLLNLLGRTVRARAPHDWVGRAGSGTLES